MIYLYTKNAYLKFLILCCMFKIDLQSKTLCCIQTCDVFYLHSITCKYLCDIHSEVCFYLHKRNKCMKFIMYQNKMPLCIYLGCTDRFHAIFHMPRSLIKVDVIYICFLLFYHIELYINKIVSSCTFIIYRIKGFHSDHIYTGWP